MVRRDYYAGAMIALIGAFGMSGALQLQIGTLRQMGPGMFPVILCTILIGLGALIAINAGDDAAGGGDELNHLAHDASPYPDLRGCAAIIGGMLAFAAGTTYLGLVPGTFACVFIAAIGDRKSTWLGSLGLATVITIAGVGIFLYGLRMPLPMFRWDF